MICSNNDYFAATSYSKDGVQVYKFIIGQKVDVDSQILTLVHDHGHEIAIKPFYNSSGIGLYDISISEAKEDRTKSVKERVKAINEHSKVTSEHLKAINRRLKANDTAYNSELKCEIREWNKVNALAIQSGAFPMRQFSNEMRISPTIRVLKSVIGYSPTELKYTITPQVSCQKAAQILADMH